MSNSDQYQRDGVKEDRQQKDEATGYYAYNFLSDGANPQLDDFLEEWREELRRNRTIIRLNADCFYEIFSYLTMEELCAVSETCRDFRRIVHAYAEGHSKRFGLHRSVFYSTRAKIALNDAKRFIRIFGPYLTTLSLMTDEFETDIEPIRFLPLLDRYCTELQDLQLDVSCSDPKAIIECKQLHSKLHRLAIGAYMWPASGPIFDPIDVTAILVNMASLKHLELNCLRMIVRASDRMVHKSLESLSLRNTLLPRTDHLTAFLRKNDQLKRLKFSSCFLLDTLQAVTLPTFPNLESFWFRFRDNKYNVPRQKVDEMQLQHLHLSNIAGDISALRKLCIDLNIFQKTNLNSILARLATHNTIENLSISNSNEYPVGLESHLCALTNLKVLKLNYVKGFDNEIVKKLACGLPNLTYVGFESCGVDLTMIENFLEHSHSVKIIYLFTYAPYNEYTPLTVAMLLSMVDARLRNKYRDQTPLTLILNRKFILDGRQFEKGLIALLEDCAEVIKVLPSRGGTTGTRFSESQ